MIAIAAGEAENPAVAVKKAFRVTIVRLFVFYIATLALILAIAPMDKILSGGKSLRHGDAGREDPGRRQCAELRGDHCRTVRDEQSVVRVFANDVLALTCW